jgi:hypothetical protein
MSSSFASRLVYLLANVVLILLGFLLFEWTAGSANQLLWSGVASSVVATGFCGIVVFVYVFLGESRLKQAEELRESGFRAVFSARGHSIRDEYRTRTERAKRQIDVQGFGLRTLAEDFQVDFSAWKIRAKVRILLVDPDFPTPDFSYAAQRDREEGSDENKIRGDVRHFIEVTRPLMDERFQVRLYRCLPSINIFRVDSEMLWGPYLMNRVSRNTVTILVGEGETFKAFEDHFDRLWDMSRPA